MEHCSASTGISRPSYRRTGSNPDFPAVDLPRIHALLLYRYLCVLCYLYTLNLMLMGLLREGEVFLCGTGTDARAINDKELVEDARRITIEGIAEQTTADQILVF